MRRRTLQRWNRVKIYQGCMLCGTMLTPFTRSAHDKGLCAPCEIHRWLTANRDIIEAFHVKQTRR